MSCPLRLSQPLTVTQLELHVTLQRLVWLNSVQCSTQHAQPDDVASAAATTASVIAWRARKPAVH
eukprot:6475598-Amphidinium_carterae.3